MTISCYTQQSLESLRKSIEIFPYLKNYHNEYDFNFRFEKRVRIVSLFTIQLYNLYSKLKNLPTKWSLQTNFYTFPNMPL